MSKKTDERLKVWLVTAINKIYDADAEYYDDLKSIRIGKTGNQSDWHLSQIDIIRSAVKLSNMPHKTSLGKVNGETDVIILMPTKAREQVELAYNKMYGGTIQ